MPTRMNASTLFSLAAQAFSAVLRHKTRSALNIVGITIGIASVVWVIAIGEAGAAVAKEQLQNLGDNLVWVEAGSRNIAGVRTGTHGAHSLTLQDAQAILDEVPLIRRVSPQVDGAALLASETANWTTRYRGITADYLDIKRWTIATGHVFTGEDLELANNVCVIGKTVQDRLFGAANPVGQLVRVSGQPFEVIGVLDAKGQSGTGQDQDDTIFVPHTTAMKKLRGGGQTWLDDIVCSAVSPESVSAASAQITALMRQRHNTAEQEEDFNIRHPEEIVNAQLEAARAFETLLVSIALVSLLVGGIGVMNVMLASVLERTREIGVRLAVGAPAWAIELQFLAEAIILTTFGGVLGIALSVGGSSGIGRLLGWTITIPVQALVAAVGFSAAVGLVFGFFPSRRASRLDPIAALHAE
jgi:putative ABC transport system permease protein